MGLLRPLVGVVTGLLALSNLVRTLEAVRDRRKLSNRSTVHKIMRNGFLSFCLDLMMAPRTTKQLADHVAPSSDDTTPEVSWDTSSPTDDYDPEAPSPLLDLPREIRDKVFDHLLVEPEQVKLLYDSESPYKYARAVRVNFAYGRKKDPGKTTPPPGSEVCGVSTTFRDLMSVMLTCKRFHDEAPEIFFRRNEFLVYTNWGIPKPTSLHMKWISRIELWCRPVITGLTVAQRPSWIVLEKSRMFVCCWIVQKPEDDEDSYEGLLKEWLKRAQRALQQELKGTKMMDLNIVGRLLANEPLGEKMDLVMHPSFVPELKRESLEEFTRILKEKKETEM